MAQKTIPISNKVGYSMFWNSMWDSKNNFSKVNQINFFIKFFLNFFFNDFFKNYYFYIYKFKNFFYKSMKIKHELNIVDNKGGDLIFKNNYKNNLYISKIWLFKYQNWIIIYFVLYSKINFDNFKKHLINNYDNFNTLNLLNNYYLNLFKINLNSNYLNNLINCKNNF